MKHGQPNALTFFIMAQALKNVKPALDPKVTEMRASDGDEGEDIERSLSDGPEIDDRVLSIDWAAVDDVSNSFWFNQSRNPCVVVEDYDFIVDQVEHDRVVVMVDEMSDDIQAAVSSSKRAGHQVWLSPRKPSFWRGLGEKDISLSNQLGFGFVVMSDYREHFEASKHFWRHFFVSHQSRQWIWPWCDIILANLANSIKPGSVKKTWTDPLSPKSLVKLEEDVFKAFETVLGGQGMTSVILMATSRHLAKKSFLDDMK